MTHRHGLIDFYPHQRDAVELLRTGSILQGGVGSGKSLTSVLYFYTKECKGEFNPPHVSGMKEPKDLYIITTAKKRDSLDWMRECSIFGLAKDREYSVDGVSVTVDSWNNIKKYIAIKDAFFIFDEQRVIGSGVWVKSFLKITKFNNWILLTATPGDTWMDYIPVFLANGFYKNRTEFIRRHVVYKSYMNFPKIDRFLEINRLEKLKKYITVVMNYEKETTLINENILVDYDKKLLNETLKKRWNPFTNKPIKNSSQLFYTIRKITNMHESRFKAIEDILKKHKKVIVFYNFNYELEALRQFKKCKDITVAEYNGHKHEDIPQTNSWVYLVQYISGSEGWNCIETNTIIFYSQNYSYRMMTQAAGRIDRLNTPFTKLYYYHLVSNSFLDKAIQKALNNKKSFNERNFNLAVKT